MVENRFEIACTGSKKPVLFTIYFQFLHTYDDDRTNRKNGMPCFAVVYVYVGCSPKRQNNQNENR